MTKKRSRAELAPETLTSTHFIEGVSEHILQGHELPPDVVQSLLRHMVQTGGVASFARVNRWHDSCVLRQIAAAAKTRKEAVLRHSGLLQLERAQYLKHHSLGVRLWCSRGPGSRTMSLGFVRIVSVQTQGLVVSTTATNDAVGEWAKKNLSDKKQLMEALYGHTLGRAQTLDMHRAMCRVDKSSADILDDILHARPVFKQRSYVNQEYRLSTRGSQVFLYVNTNLRVVHVHPLLCAHLAPTVANIVSAYDA